MTSPPDDLTAALAGRYTIERQIGQGGMATVYLALDVRHNRPVAVKVLRPELAAAMGADRFLREIEIAANLTHPHILPLYDSGEAGGFLFYVMPYLEGDTLRQRLEREGELPIGESVRVIREVVDALAFAHSHGVIHRDIKPDNVMLSGGHAIVTDFGVAKAVSEATGANRITTAGVALGTPAYMSPEQATADQHVDHRSDIYAVGAMAYELLTGRPPFQATTAQGVLAAQVTKPANPVSQHRDQVSPQLETLVMKCLAKKPADRWQSAGEMLPHLDVLSTPGGGLAPTAPHQGADRRRRLTWMAVGAAVAVVVIAMFGAALLGGDPLTITTSDILHVTTDPGLEFQPSLSPDGNEVAYVAGPLDATSVVVRSAIDISSGGENTLTAGQRGSHYLPSWTPDGSAIRFVACDQSLANCQWNKVGKYGGASTPLPMFSGRQLNSAWSSDGTKVAFSSNDSIFVYSPGDDAGPRLIGLHEVLGGIHSLAWSPDGKLLAYVAGNSFWRFSGNLSTSSIWVISIDGGAPIAVTSQDHMNLSPQWLPDSRHLLFISERDGPRGVYLTEIGRHGPVGEIQSVAPSIDPHSISISAEGTKLAYAKFSVRQNIWSIPIAESTVSISDAEPVTAGNQVVESHDLSPDGLVITYDGSRLGDVDIYRVAVAGGTPQRLADLPGEAFGPVWSPDGTEIAFMATETGPNSSIVVVPADGGEPQVVADLPELDDSPAWSPDGNRIVFRSWSRNSGMQGMWTISRAGPGAPWGQPEQFSQLSCLEPVWHPDGERLMCTRESEAIIVDPGGEVTTRLKPDIKVANAQFSADGSTIYFIGGTQGDNRGIYGMPVTGGDPVLLVAFDDPSMSVLSGSFYHSLTVGSDRFYVTISQYDSDIWVMDLEY